MKKEVTIQFDNAKASEPQKAVLDGDFSGGGGSIWDDMVVSYKDSFDTEEGLKVYIRDTDDVTEQEFYIERYYEDDDGTYTDQYFEFSSSGTQFTTEKGDNSSTLQVYDTTIDMFSYVDNNQNAEISLLGESPDGYGMNLNSFIYNGTGYTNNQFTMTQFGPKISVAGLDSQHGITLSISPSDDTNHREYRYVFTPNKIALQIYNPNGTLYWEHIVWALE